MCFSITTLYLWANFLLFLLNPEDRAYSLHRKKVKIDETVLESKSIEKMSNQIGNKNK